MKLIKYTIRPSVVPKGKSEEAWQVWEGSLGSPEWLGPETGLDIPGPITWGREHGANKALSDMCKTMPLSL